MLRDPSQEVPGWENPPLTSYTSGFRAPDYPLDQLEETDTMAALKAFPMSPNSNELSMLMVRNYAIKARDLVIEEALARADREPPVPADPAAMDVERWFGDNDHIPRKYLVPPPRVPALATLRQIPFCAHLDRGQLQQLVDDSETVTCEADEVLFREGDRADRCFIILAGSVRVYRLGADGEEDEITVLCQGQFFGEQALFDQGLRSATVKCAEPCELLIIDGQRFFSSVAGT